MASCQQWIQCTWQAWYNEQNHWDRVLADGGLKQCLLMGAVQGTPLTEYAGDLNSLPLPHSLLF